MGRPANGASGRDQRAAARPAGKHRREHAGQRVEAHFARDIREEVWRRLAGDWKPAHLDAICTREVGLDTLPSVFATMLAGGSRGRTLVTP